MSKHSKKEDLRRFRNLLLQLPAFREAEMSPPSDEPPPNNLEEVFDRLFFPKENQEEGSEDAN